MLALAREPVFQYGSTMVCTARASAQKKASRHLAFALLAFALSLASLMALLYVFLPREQGLGRAALDDSLTVVSRGGRIAKGAEIAGRPYLVFFGYTHCADFCPTALLEISSVLKALGPDEKAGGLFITVDPERDTPEVLKSYLENFDPRIFALTGDPEKTAALAKTFRAYAARVSREPPGDYDIAHTGLVYLMDKRGLIVSTFDVQQPPQEAARKLKAYL